MRSDIFSAGIEKTMVNVMENRWGKERVAQLMKKAKSITSWHEYDDFVRPLTGFGYQCPRPER